MMDVVCLITPTNDATGAVVDHGCEKAESEVSDSLEVANYVSHLLIHADK